MKNKNIAIAGLGYVGLSNALALSVNHNVIAFDIDKNKIDLINRRESPFKEYEIKRFLRRDDISLKATYSKEEAFNDADVVLIATPTNYDEETNYFDTSSLKSVMQDVLSINQNVLILIRSTIPVGFIKEMRRELSYERIIFAPEFLREGNSLNDILNPSRIVVGDKGSYGKEISELLLSSSHQDSVKVILTDPDEAEAIKLFSNSYLAMRVAFFNELDSYSMSKDLNTKDIIDGISSDNRIGEFYNNPSFGYGGYCLPKDSKQLLANFKTTPNSIIKSIVSSNQIRKQFLVDKILESEASTIGVYRLIMKAGSDNFRSAAIFDIMYALKERGLKIYVYEPFLTDQDLDFELLNDLQVFKKHCDLILANRIGEELTDIVDKVFTRDVYQVD